jgi:hypothetical protein
MSMTAIERTANCSAPEQGQVCVVNECVALLFSVAKYLNTYGAANAMNAWFFLYALHMPLDASTNCASAVEQLRQHAARIGKDRSEQDCASVYGAYEDCVAARLADGSLSPTDYTTLPFAWPHATECTSRRLFVTTDSVSA